MQVSGFCLSRCLHKRSAARNCTCCPCSAEKKEVCLKELKLGVNLTGFVQPNVSRNVPTLTFLVQKSYSEGAERPAALNNSAAGRTWK